MRLVGIILAAVLASCAAIPVHALVPPVTDPTIELDADKSVLVSSLYAKHGEAFVELRNNTDRAVDVSNWSIRFISESSENDVVLPAGWLQADSFIALAEDGVVPGVYTFSSLGLPILEPLARVELYDQNETLVSAVEGFPADIVTKWYQRKSTGLSGTFTNDFSTATASTKLRHTPLYIPPTQPPVLRIVEIYPHASDCSPSDVGILCGDYVKLYNPTEQVAYTADYRVRSDSGVSESGNAFHLDAYDDLAPGGYLTISLRDDGDRMSLTDSGGWIWLEDVAGVTRYDETIVSYPSASSATKVGYSWALDVDDAWQWTATPMPGQANAFPAAAAEVIGATPGALVACPQGKYRNPETNRCRNIEDAIATLAACAEGQARNPATNRCRSVVMAQATLAACAAGQERNPATNRCRSVLASTNSLAPCASGQERNPATNRCRKTGIDPALSPANIDPVAQNPTSSPLAMTLIGAVGIGAIGYGFYEWRSELSGVFRRLVGSISKK